MRQVAILWISLFNKFTMDLLRDRTVISPQIKPISGKSRSQKISSKYEKAENFRSNRQVCISIILAIVLINFYYDIHSMNHQNGETAPPVRRSRKRVVLLASSHIVLTKDDNGQSLVLTGDDGKGKGKGKGGGGDRLVIAGHGMGGDGANSNMVMQDASNREGDVVINGNSMIVPGEDGHIVLADSRRNDQQRPSGPPPNLWAFWMPFLRNSRMAYNYPFFGSQFG